MTTATQVTRTNRFSRVYQTCKDTVSPISLNHRYSTHHFYSIHLHQTPERKDGHQSSLPDLSNQKKKREKKSTTPPQESTVKHQASRVPSASASPSSNPPVLMLVLVCLMRESKVQVPYLENQKPKSQQVQSLPEDFPSS
jgi:hypothetical protein